MEPIIAPVDKELIKSELTPDRFMRDTRKGGNKIYIIDCNNAPNTMREIGRLREIAFRFPGGGTGLALDIDQFDTMDPPCQQLIVWNPDAEEIIGGYRFILGENIRTDEQGRPRIATSHLFDFSDKFLHEYLPHTIELGRSFVTLEYQSSRAGAKGLFALDNLWDGLGALTVDYPHAIRRASLPQEVRFPNNLPVGLPSTLLERRPDVREAEQALIAAYAEVGVAYTSMFPSLSLTSQLGAENDEVKHLLESPYHLIAGTVLQPIFGFGKNRARLKARKAARERATYAYEKAVLTALRDAYDAIATFNKMKEIYQTRLQLEQSSKSSLELAQLQYVNGAIGYMDLLDAQRTYLDAQIGLSNALRDRQLAMVNVYKALGGGWSVDE